MLRLHTLRRLAAAADAIAQPSFLRPLTSGAGSGQQAAGFAAGGLAEEREYSEHDGGGPLDDRRTVEDYNRLLAQLGNRKRCGPRSAALCWLLAMQGMQAGESGRSFRSLALLGSATQPFACRAATPHLCLFQRHTFTEHNLQ